MIPAETYCLIRHADLNLADCIPFINAGVHPVPYKNIGNFHTAHLRKKRFPVDTAFNMHQKAAGNMVLRIERSFRLIQIEHGEIENSLSPSYAETGIVKTAGNRKRGAFHPDAPERVQENQNVIHGNNCRPLMVSIHQGSPVQIKHLPLKT